MNKLLILCCLAFSCSKHTVIAPPSFPVKAAVAAQKEVPVFIEAVGHVDSITAIDVRSRIEGELTGVYFKQGQEVKKGDLLFTIDPKPYEAILKQAKAELQQNEARLILAEEKVKRYRTLANDEYYSQIDYETLQTNYATSLAQVEQGRAQVERASIDLSYCWIYAPIDGKMGILKVDFGNLVTDAGTALATLNQMAPIYVTFSIPEFQLPKVQKAGKCLNVLAAYEDFENDEIFEGKLFMIDNAVDPNTGMIKLRGIFQNDKRELWPGQFVRTRLIIATLANAVVIPYDAIQLTQSGPVIFVIKSDQTIEQRNVVLGPREDGHIVITRGLQAGEKVAIEGQMNLYDGVKVYEPL